MKLYYYTREIIATGARETLPFDSSHHAAFGGRQEYLFPPTAFRIMQQLIDRWNGQHPACTMYRYEIAPTRCGEPV